MATDELLLLIIIPLAAGIINIILPGIAQKALSFIALLLSSYLVYRLSYIQTATNWIFNRPVFSFDNLSLCTLIFIQALGIIILVFSLYGLNKKIERRFFILFPLTIAFCNGTVISFNSISFMFFWGLSGLVLYLFALLGSTPDSPVTAKKTFIIVGGSDVFLIMGFVLLWFLIPGSDWSLKDLHLPLKGLLAWTAFIFLLIASFAKAGGFPLHTWVPDFSKDAPIESVALLPASCDKLLGIYLLSRIMTEYFTVMVFVNMIVISLGAVTVISAVMMAINQHNGRRLLGYHAVSQVGYMIMGVGSGNLLALAGGLFHMINHIIYKSGLFLCLASVEKKTGTSDLDYLGGLGKNMPITFLSALTAALSISGIPPLNGFFSKWMIYQGLLEQTRTLSSGYRVWMLFCIIIAVFGSVLTLASFIKFLHAVFLGRRPEIHSGIKEAPVNQLFSNVVLASLCILFGLFAWEIPLKYFIYPAASAGKAIIPAFIGLYNPLFIYIMLIIPVIIGIVVYGIFARVRYDELYLGGMTPSENFRISGTGFYNEVVTMKPLRSLYDMAEKKYFDLYDVFRKTVLWFSEILRWAHSGQLQLYLLYLFAGLLLMILLM